MSPSSRRKARWVVVLAALLAGSGGCVERIMKISTSPAGARVIVNDEDIGVSPVKFAFTWYGDYDIVIRKTGYETLKTHYRVSPPWYQVPPIDLFAETLVPGTLRDVHELPVYELTPAPTVVAGELVGRAEQLRDESLFQGSPPSAEQPK
jgi:PEGA domain